MTLREVEIYIPNVEYRTCFYSSQESGETWWPSKCHEWTFGLKSGYQQVREVLKVHTCLPSAVGVSNISEIWVWYKAHFQIGGEGRCFFRWTSVFLYFRLKNTWRVNAASIYYVDILITTNESHVSRGWRVGFFNFGSGRVRVLKKYFGSGRVGYRVFVSNTKSIGYYGVLKSWSGIRRVSPLFPILSNIYYLIWLIWSIKHVFGRHIYVIVVQCGRSWQSFGERRKSHKPLESAHLQNFVTKMPYL